MVELKSGWKPLALQAVAGNGEVARAQEGMGSWAWLGGFPLPGWRASC